MSDPFPGYTAPFADPFGAFIMSEFHAPDVEARIISEELAAIPGQVLCSGDATHTTACVPFGACPTCGAEV